MDLNDPFYGDAPPCITKSSSPPMITKYPAMKPPRWHGKYRFLCSAYYLLITRPGGCSILDKFFTAGYERIDKLLVRANFFPCEHVLEKGWDSFLSYGILPS